MSIEIPLPLPDELLYSAIARGLARTGAKQTKFSATVLSRHRPINPLCSDGLKRLVHQIYPRGLGVSARDILHRATMADTILPFMAEAKRLEAMYDGIRPTTVTNHYKHVMEQGLRCCPRCMEEDRSAFGEAYWRRIHQIDAARVCLKHRKPLLIGATRKSFTSQYVALDEVQTFTPVCTTPIKLNANWRIVRQVATLFQSPVTSFSREAFADRVTSRIELSGPLVTTSKDLSKVLLSRFGEACFKELRLEVKDRVCKDAVRVMGFAKDAARAHFYAMIAERCRERLASMLRRCTEPWMPGIKEYPCLNNRCDSKVQRVITDIDKKTRRIFFHFHCPQCGLRCVRVRPIAVSTHLATLPPLSRRIDDMATC